MSPSTSANDEFLPAKGCAILSNEINIGTIRSVEQQIKEHEMAIIRLKRVRNSLLNVSRLPPEILGDIFCQNVTFKGLFGGLGKGSHNFLLVCHHWFEVASCTPDLWSFWGNNLRDWTKLHLRYPTSPVDLVLDGSWNKSHTLHESLRNALQDRATRDTLRRIHLRSRDPELLASVISPLSGCGEIRSSSVESIIILDELESVDLSDFFTYYRFPKLRHLELSGFNISSWDLISSRTSALTTLDLYFDSPSLTPTTAQLLSILSSNPDLRRVSISGTDFRGNESSLRVTLHQLRELELIGNTSHVFGLLHQLEHPGSMKSLVISAVDSTNEDILKTIGPYLGDYLRRRGRSQNGLGLFLSSSSEDCIELQVGDVGGIDFSALGPAQMDKFVDITIYLDQVLPNADAALDLIAHAPREDIVYFRTHGRPVTTQTISIRFPHIRALHYEGTLLSTAFPAGPNFDEHPNVFPSLQRVNLDRVIVPHDDWGPLIAFLACRASSGRRLDILEINGPVFIRAEVMESIKEVVGVFRLTEIKSSPQVRWARLG